MTNIIIRKTKITFTTGQRLEYAKLMVDEDYTNKQVMEISEAGASSIACRNKQYI